MGRTACTEPQCLYKGALYLYLFIYVFGETGPVSRKSIERRDEGFELNIYKEMKQ